MKKGYFTEDTFNPEKTIDQIERAKKAKDPIEAMIILLGLDKKHDKHLRQFR